MATYDWINGLPVQTDSNSEWSGGLPYIIKGGTTLYQATLTGAMTFAGTLIQKPKQIITGNQTNTGNLIKKSKKIHSGSITPAGGKWSGLGMCILQYQDGGNYSDEDYDGWIDTLLANGFDEFREIPTYQNTTRLAVQKAAIIRNASKGAKYIFGVSSNSTDNPAYTITAANYEAFRTAIKAAAQWAQDNEVFEFQLGNEEEYHVDGTTMTVAQIITNLKSIATEVQAIFTRGSISYSCGFTYVNTWIAAGRGDIDIIATNAYTQDTGVALPWWGFAVDDLVTTFGADHTYLTEFNLDSAGLSYYSADEGVQATGIRDMIARIQTAGMTRALYFLWKHDTIEFGVLKDDNTYRQLWYELISGDTSLTKKIKQNLSSAISFIGELIRGPITYRAIHEGIITFVGTLTKKVSQIHTGLFIASGELNKKIRQILVGAITFAGTLNKLIKQNILGAFTPSGTLNKLVKHILSGILTFIGTLTRTIDTSTTNYLYLDDGVPSSKFQILQEDNYGVVLELGLIPPTVLWKEAIKANQREFKCYVRFYFDGENTVPYDFTEATVESIDLLEETFAEGQTPLGAVSSNELVISLHNDSHQFSPRNISSPYYGKLLPNIRVDAYIGLKVAEGAVAAEDTYEYVDLGTFYVSNWSAPTNSIMANVICNDRLFNIFNAPMPQIPIQENINMSTMFAMLFNSLGLSSSDYTIDAISYGINIAALPQSSGDNIRDGMQQMAERALCNVFVPRNDNIRVLRNNNVEPASFTWTDSDMIIDADQPTDYANIFSQVEIGYHIPFVGQQSNVLTIESIDIPTGGITLNNLFFSSVVGAVENVSLIGATNSSISSMTIGARSISLTISNDGISETVAIAVSGRVVSTIDATYTATDSTAQALIGNVKFPFDSEYIQSKEAAMESAYALLPLVTDPSAYITANSRGDPSIELTNSILINDVIDLITNLEVVPIRMHYDFTSGLTCDMMSIKKSVREDIYRGI
jgi:hypothetical protein